MDKETIKNYSAEEVSKYLEDNGIQPSYCDLFEGI